MDVFRIRLIEIADATTQITDLRDETRLLGGLGLARTREHIANFFYLSVFCGLIDIFSKDLPSLVFQRLDVGAKRAWNGCRDDLSRR